MMKKRKGLTLVETLVALAIFLMLFTSVLTIYLGSKKTVIKQEEYLKFETICLDIDKYSDKYGRDWNLHYFNSTDPVIYYSGGYERVLSTDTYKYTLKYDYNEKNELIVNIKNERDGYFVIENLNYGGNRYGKK